MKNLFKQVVLVLTVLLLSVSFAQATPYIIGKLGAYVPDDGAFENGYGVRGAFGLSFSDLGFGNKPRAGSWLDKLMVEAGVGLYTADVDAAGQNGDLTVMPVTVSGVFVHRLPTVPIELRAAVGLGTYFVDFDTSFKNKSTVKQGLYLNAGAIFNVNEKFGILADVDLDNTSSDVGGWMVNAGMRYRF